MIAAPNSPSDRLLAALGAFRKAVVDTNGSGRTPDPEAFVTPLSQAERIQFFSSIAELSSRDGATGEFDAKSPDFRGTMTLDSHPANRGDTSVVGELSTLGTDEGDPDKTKKPSQYETMGHGEFEADGMTDSTPSMSIDRLADYELLSELGRGGMGVVYKARQKALNRIVALKMVLSGGRASKQQLARFMGEARAVARLDHPNIVQVYDIGEHDGLPFFAMEYVEGGALDSAVKKQSMEGIPAARLMESVCRAMHYAHTKGVIHRDLKPANILLMSDAVRSVMSTKSADKISLPGTGVHSALKSTTGPVPKITDFGLAKQLDDENDGATRSGAVMGTPNYMAPEQADGNTKNVTHLADVYSLGATLYELITGRPPFQGPSIISVLSLVRTADPVNPSRLQPGIAKDLETICLKAMQKEPAKRYETAEAMADDLSRFLDGQPILARPIGSIEKVVRWCRRKPREAGLWLSAAALAATLFGVFLWSDLRVRGKNVEIAKKNDLLAEANTEIANERDAVTRQSQLNAKQVKYLLRTLSAELKALGLTKQREKLVAKALEYIGQLEQLDKESQGIADRGRVSGAIQIAEFYQELGTAEKDAASLEKAREYYGKAVSFAEAIAKAEPESDLARGNFALSLSRLADAKSWYQEFDGPDGATALADRAMVLRKEIVDSPKSVAGTRAFLFPADRLMSLASSHVQKARFAAAGKDKKTSREHEKQALSLRQTAFDMAKADPKTTEEPLVLVPIQEALSQSYLVEAAELSAEAGVEKDKAKADMMRKEAEVLLTKALTVFEKAVEENADSLPFKKDLSSILFKVGVNHLIAGRNADARDAFDRTYAIRDQLMKQGDEAQSAQNRWDTSLALYGVGTANVKLNERAKGMSAFRECLRLREKLLSESDNLTFVRGVMCAAARIGDHSKTWKLLETEETRSPSRMSPMFQYDTVCGLSLAAHAVGSWADDAKLTADQKALREKYLAKAWQYAEKLSLANNAKAREFATDPDCEFLQSRAAFKEKLEGILKFQK